MNHHTFSLYALLQEYGRERFLAVFGFCHQQQVYGAAYVMLILRMPPDSESKVDLFSGQPMQDELDVEINWKKARFSDKL